MCQLWGERRSDERELFSGETYDYTGEYRIVRFYEQNSFETEWQWDDVTLVTHASMDKLARVKKKSNYIRN